MKKTLKIVMMLAVIVSSFNVSAQTKAEKKKAKVKKFNNSLLIENKAPLLDGKHQTKAFFTYVNSINSTADICNEFSIGDGKKIYINDVFEDEIQNYFINMASEAGHKFGSFVAYAGGVKKVKAFDQMRKKIEIFVDGKQVKLKKEYDYMFSTDSDRLFLTTNNDYSGSRDLKFFFRNQQELLMKDCKIHAEVTYYLPKSYFNEKDAIFYKNKTEIKIKSNTIQYKYDEAAVTKHFIQVLAKSFNYYDLESKDESVIKKAFNTYKKSKRIKSESIVELSTIKHQWFQVKYSNIDAIKGRSSWVIIFFKDKATNKYRSVCFKIYQEKLYDDKYGEIQLSDATEDYKSGLAFLNQYNKQIGIYLKTNSLESAL